MYIKVATVPGAKKERIEQSTPDSFLVSVREPAERNMANRRVVELIANWYKIPSNKVKLVTGHHSRHKILDVESLESI